MCLDEMWLCLQQQVNVLTAVQLRQLATLQWILFAFQSHKRQPVCLLPQCMQRCVLTIATSMLLTLQIHHRHHHHHNAKRLAEASHCCDQPLKRSVLRQSLWHPCRGRSGGSRSCRVDHRHVSTPVMAAHHLSSWCRFVRSDLQEQYVEVGHRSTNYKSLGKLKLVHWVNCLGNTAAVLATIPSMPSVT